MVNIRFRSKLKDLLEKPHYLENIRKTAEIMNDNPLPSLDLAVYWCEYLIRHKGAPHLRPATHEMYWFQELVLDVIMFVLVSVTLTIYVVIAIFKLLYRVCCKRKQKTE